MKRHLKVLSVTFALAASLAVPAYSMDKSGTVGMDPAVLIYASYLDKSGTVGLDK